jgi:hypothetical protein
MVLVQVALAMSALMALMAIGVDAGMLLVERRHAQATADAAALAAASDLYVNWFTNNGADPSGSAANSAFGVASANGYSNDGTTSTVTVNIPPLSGNFQGKAGYAEVIATWIQKPGFSHILGGGNVSVSGRAVAQGRAVGGGGAMPGILLLGNTGTTLSGVGNGMVEVTDPSGKGTAGSIYVDSKGPGAVSLKGNGNMSAPSIYIAQTGAPPSGLTATGGSINMGAAQLPDPLAYLPSPVTNPPSGVNVVALPNGITGSMNLTSNTVYIVGGPGISLAGNSTLTGTNVMLFVTGANASINLTGNGAVNLSPMTTGPYQGITIFQDPSDTNSGKMAGNGNLTVSGTVYVPAAGMTDTGNGATDTFGSQIIAQSLTTKGNGTVNVQFDGNSNQVPNTRSFGLVE